MLERKVIRKSVTSTVAVICSVMTVMMFCGEFIRIELLLEQQNRKLINLQEQITSADNNFGKVTRKLEHINDKIISLMKGKNKKAKQHLYRRSVDQHSVDASSDVNTTDFKLLKDQLSKIMEEKIKNTMSSLFAAKYFVMIPGPPGPQGKTGEKGNKGSRGRKGNKGPRGPRGPTGPMGKPGRRGKQGVPGLKGEPGENGAPGPRGMMGLKGDRGPSLERPSAVISPPHLTVNESKSATFHCSVSGYPRPEIVWSKVNGILAANRSMIINRSGKFKILNVISTDSGIYQCKASNILGKVYTSATLQVNFSPRVVLNSGPTYAKIGDNVTVPACHVTGYPKPKVMWYKSVGGLPKTRFMLQNNSLVILDAKKEDSGTYLCRAENLLGSEVAGSTLVIVQLPHITVKPPSSLYPALGSTIILNCSAAGDPKPVITWRKENGEFPAGRYEVRRRSLVLRNIVNSDFGVFICTATSAGVFFTEVKTSLDVKASDCSDFYKSGERKNGVYTVKSGRNPSQGIFQVYCDMTADGGGWTLVARFSNIDTKNWMRENALWWYDRTTGQGNTTNSTVNQDMISPAFGSVTGSEFKVTRSDDATHTALLRTTSNCLASRTFRSMITSYGNFRAGTVWASNKCLGSCSVVYGGKYSSTEGFSQAKCNGNIQKGDKIGFWCDWKAGDGAVMMIGGGGAGCARADHGIGITEENAAKFVANSDACDFGNAPCPSGTNYALNLWIR